MLFYTFLTVYYLHEARGERLGLSFIWRYYMDNKKKAHTCSECGGKFSDVELVDFDGLLLCPDCLGSLTVCCRDCGTRLWREDNE